MLTADLVRGYARSGKLSITKWRAGGKERALGIAKSLVAIAESAVEVDTRGELMSAMGAIDVAARDRKLADGLKKLVLDRCEFEVDAEIVPSELRADVYARAAKIRMEGALDRDELLAEVGEERGRGGDEIERLLYADLKQNQRLIAFKSLKAESLVEVYDLGQIQAVLLRAERVTFRVWCQSAPRYRDLFRALKFHRLLYEIKEIEDGGYEIKVDGPFSMFRSVTKYGLQLALVWPYVRACDRYEMNATLRWGKQRKRLHFEQEGKRKRKERAKEAAAVDPITELPDDVAKLVAKMEGRKRGWVPSACGEIFSLPGVGVCVPDLVFEREGMRVYFEVLGFWSRASVWKRVELLERGLDLPIVFAVPSRLRVSEEVLPEDLPGALYVYKGVLSAKAIEERLDSVVKTIRKDASPKKVVTPAKKKPAKKKPAKKKPAKKKPAKKKPAKKKPAKKK